MKARVVLPGIVLLSALAACGPVAGTPPADMPPAADAATSLAPEVPQTGIEQLMQRLCVDEGGDRGVRCSTFYFIDTAMPGWQEFIDSILPVYYGLPAQAYVDLVTNVGSTFVPQTYGDKFTPVYDQQAGFLGAAACYPLAESEDRISAPAGCEAVAVLIPRPEARSVDGTSVFPRTEYLVEIFGHLESITTGIPEDAMRAALQTLYP
jgi:hypothetical protein